MLAAAASITCGADDDNIKKMMMAMMAIKIQMF